MNAREEIHRLDCYVENRPGVLARIVGLISGRGYNIQTLNVGPTEDGTVSRMKIDVLGTARVVQQIILQLRNQVNVIEVTSRRHARKAAALALCLGLGLAASAAPAPAASLFAPDRFTVLNVAPFQPGSEQLLAREMVEYRDRTGNDVVIYSLTLNPEGFPAMKKAEFLVESYRKLRRALEGSGVRLGVLVQATLGHWPRVDKNEEPWARSITLEGKTKRFCPADPGCRRYIADVVTLLAKEKPCFILLDDDVHASGAFGVECFCERHVKMFNAANGTRHTAASLRAAVQACKPGDATCQAFLKMQRAFVNDLVDLVRATLDKTDPTIPSGACMPYREHRFAGETARRLAAKGQPTVLRIDNSLYRHRCLTTVADSLAYTMALVDWYGRDIPYLLDESDSWPHNRWSLAASLLDLKLQAAAFCGLHGSKLWFCNAHKGRFPISRAYTDALAAHRGIHDALAAAVHGSKPVGLVAPTVGGRLPWHPSWRSEAFVGAGNWITGTAGVFGVPFCVRTDLASDDVYALGGVATVAALSDAELAQVFRHRVLVDGGAALALTARGLAHLTGVKAEKRDFRYNSERNLADGSVYPFSKHAETPFLTAVAPGAQVVTHLCYTPFGGSPDVETTGLGAVYATNALGGRVVTTAFYAQGFYWDPSETDMRKDWFLRLLGRLDFAGCTLDADQDAVLLERRAADGATLLGVFNTSFDPLNGVRLRVPRPVRAVEALDAHGAWRAAAFTVAADGTVALDARLACAEALFLKVR